jgi:hypothetical protein
MKYKKAELNFIDADIYYLRTFNEVLKKFLEFTELLNFKDIIDDNTTVPHQFYLISVTSYGNRRIEFKTNPIFSIKNYTEFHISERANIKILSLKIYAKFMRYMFKNHIIMYSSTNIHSKFEIN